MAMEMILLLFLLLLERGKAMGEVVQEVKVGSTAELPCPSSDDDHRFQFWLLLDNAVLGPGNEKDPKKYKYDVLSGHLRIKSISSSEGGYYTCVSKDIENGSSFSSKTVEVIVKKDWEDLYETDPATNLMRGLIAMGVLMIILIAGIVYYLFRRSRVIHIGDMNDEESPDETPGTYSAPGTSSIPDMAIPTSFHQGVDNPSLETDFPEVFRSMRQTNDTQI